MSLRILLLCLTLLIAALAHPRAQPVAVDVYVFWREGCPHCERELQFLHALRARDPAVRLHPLELDGNARNRRALVELAGRLGVEQLAVPFTVIGDQHLIGYDNDATTGVLIERLVKECRDGSCPDPAAEVLAAVEHDAGRNERPASLQQRSVQDHLSLPLFGDIALRELSLPVLTVVLGAVDGFNPCAMWTLVFLIGLLVGIRDRIRMWVLGTAFIVASAVVYFFFMAAWLNLILFFGMLLWIRLAVGAVAIVGGAYYLREFLANPEGVCKLARQGHRQRVLRRLRALAAERNFLLSLSGIVLLAFAVNLVELLCSAGIPVVYTQVLGFSQLPSWQYYAYLLLYIFVFMLDDLVVFVTAMATLRITGLGTQYARWSHLIGGVVLLTIGALLWLRPDLLMFG